MIGVHSAAKSIPRQHLPARLQAGCANDKEWWTTLKQASGHGCNSGIPTIINRDGNEHSTNRSKAEAFGKYFAGKCSLVDDFEDEPLPHVQPKSTAHLHKVHFRELAVARALHQLDTSKATGPDNIPACVLKTCANELAAPPPPSTPLCNVFLYWKTTGRLERGQNSPSSQEELPLTHQPIPTSVPTQHYLEGNGRHCEPRNHELPRSP